LNSEKLEKLRQAVVKTGFPLELDVDDALTSLGFSTVPNRPYIDDETGKEREVDNYALFPDPKGAFDSLRPLGVSPHLTVECKKLGNDCIVVFKAKKKVVTFHDFEGQMYDFPYLMEHRARTTQLTTDFHLGWLLTKCKMHYEEFAQRIGITRGVSPTSKKSEKSADAEDKVFSGVMQLVKAQAHDVNESISRDKTISNPYYPFFFSFLALVIDGDIVEAESIGGSPRLTPVPHAIAKAYFKPSYSENFLGYLIDIVSKEYLSKYVSVTENDAARIASAIQNDRKRMMEYLTRHSDVF
jgi:hypothetical protein